MNLEFDAVDGKKYYLSQRALEHIIYGEFTTKPTGNGQVKSILSGGLHIKDGFQSFLNNHPTIVHLYNYNSSLHEDWFYVRELQNGVLTAKLPRILFNKRAASATLSVDKYYISGYLWKTLFPEGTDEKKLIAYIKEGLENLDLEKSENNQLIGYCNIQSDPTKIIRLMYFIHDNNNIASCFPTWTQPYTGNNGKAFSHKHVLSYPIVQSTMMIDYEFDRKKLPLTKLDIDLLETEVILVSGEDDFTLEKDIQNLNIKLSSNRIPAVIAFKHEFFSLLENTPKIFVEREIPKPVHYEKYETNRNKIFKKITKKQRNRRKNIKEYIQYIKSLNVIKYNFECSTYIYNNFSKILVNCDPLFNCANIYENIIESIKIIYICDNKDKSTFLLDNLDFILENLITFDFYDHLQKKRILTLIGNLCHEYHDVTIIEKFINALMDCPSRFNLLKEYNQCRMSLNLIDTPKTYDNLGELLDEIGLTNNLGFSIPDVIDFLKETLEENYIITQLPMNFDEYLLDLIFKQSPNFSLLVQDHCRYINDIDFMSFSAILCSHIDKLIENNIFNNDLAENLYDLVDEYIKIQVAQRKQLNLLYIMKYNANHEKAKELKFPLTLTEENKYTICLFIERSFNSIFSHRLCDKLKEYLTQNNNTTLIQKIEQKIEAKIGKDIPPNPEWLPEFIKEKIGFE
ncbi:hypothetical protein [Acinetobacter indicus]|uniref:hypothetical protein n=1 Tax=Acinetobacter indicus TaxID=756892 RepID=UPI0034CF6B2F